MDAEQIDKLNASLNRIAAATLATAVIGSMTRKPSLKEVQAAFNDCAWQAETRTVLKRESARLAELVGKQGFDAHATPLFVWFETQDAAALHHGLASKGIWTRLFEHGPKPSLRIGLTGSAEQWTRFAAAFETLT